MAQQVDAVPGHFGIGGKGDHIDSGDARRRRYGAHFLAQQRAEQKRRPASQQAFRRQQGAFGGAAGIARLEQEARVGDIEQRQLRSVEKRRPLARQISRQRQQQADFDGAGLAPRRLLRFGLDGLGQIGQRQTIAGAGSVLVGRRERGFRGRFSRLAGPRLGFIDGRRFDRGLFIGAEGFVLDGERG